MLQLLSLELSVNLESQWQLVHGRKVSVLHPCAICSQVVSLAHVTLHMKAHEGQ